MTLTTTETVDYSAGATTRPWKRTGGNWCRIIKHAEKMPGIPMTRISCSARC
ncbi:MAG: hypothetical protein ACLT0Y_03320 [Christensenellales bacterium]